MNSQKKTVSSKPSNKFLLIFSGLINRAELEILNPRNKPRIARNKSRMKFYFENSLWLHLPAIKFLICNFTSELENFQ